MSFLFFVNNEQCCCFAFCLVLQKCNKCETLIVKCETFTIICENTKKYECKQSFCVGSNTAEAAPRTHNERTVFIMLSQEALEKRRAYQKEYRKRNAAHCKEYNRKYLAEYRKKNPEKFIEYQREWRKKNADRVKAYNEKYWENKANKDIDTLKSSIAAETD